MSNHKPGSTLTDKEKMFCAEYIIDSDAANAAIRAGYNEESAAATGCEMKQRPDVEAYINKLLDDKQLLSRITVNEVLAELSKIAFAEVVDFVNNEEADKDAGQSELPDNFKARQTPDEKEMLKYYYRRKHGPDKKTVSHCTAASACKIVHFDSHSGRTTTIQFSLPAKIAALKLLGRYLGLFGATGKPMLPKPTIIFPREMLPKMNNKAA